MTNRLEINWKLDGFVDEQCYYCSETFIKADNLPTPKFILNGEDRMHEDTDIEVDRNYFVAIGSVKNGIEKLSENKYVSTFKIGSQIDEIFNDRSKGCAYDFNDLSTMFQDPQKTIKVTEIDQPVGFVIDKSGNENHLKSLGSNRPILKRNGETGAFYLSFDGGKSMQCQNFNISKMSKISLFHGVILNNINSVQVISELSNDYNSNQGSFLSVVADSTFSFGMNSPYSLSSANIGDPLKKVISIYADRLKQNNKIEYIRFNGDYSVLNNQFDGVSSYFLNNILNIGARAGNQFHSNSDFYSFILICKKLEMSKVEEIELSISTLMGI